MSKQVFVFPDQDAAERATAEYLLNWCAARPGAALGGATGRSPLGVWATIWDRLNGERKDERDAFLDRNVVFLDEYFGAYPAYYHWAWRNLRVDRGGFAADRVFTPRGCFFEQGRIVSSRRLERILNASPGDWEARTLPGEEGTPPEVHIVPSAKHPVLAEIRQSLDDYDRLAREQRDRVQLLGIGVGGAIPLDPDAGGHIGFVEYGAASPDARTTLVRLAPSTLAANRGDFHLRAGEVETPFEPSTFAVTQGVATILSAAHLLMMAWGASKREPVKRMFLGVPSPKNPAAWVGTHPSATVFLDQPAFGELDPAALELRGWRVEINPSPAKLTQGM